jgi:mRNA interferase RelE/StbE
LRIEYRKRFLKDLSKIPSKTRNQIEQLAFEELPSLENYTSSKKIEKLKGYPNYFKIRIGSYRLGLKFERNLLILERVLHRKEIYRYFP